jgi:hypothetical protein
VVKTEKINLPTFERERIYEDNNNNEEPIKFKRNLSTENEIKQENNTEEKLNYKEIYNQQKEYENMLVG